jgi:hypothetical protein
MSTLSELSSLNQNLLDKQNVKEHNNPTFRKASFKDKLKLLFGMVPKFEYKIVRCPRLTFPHTKSSNQVDNRKTSIITFLPKLLITEFKQFLNLYFLILCISQIVPALQVGKCRYLVNLRFLDQLFNTLGSYPDYPVL